MQNKTYDQIHRELTAKFNGPVPLNIRFFDTSIDPDGRVIHRLKPVVRAVKKIDHDRTERFVVIGLITVFAIGVAFLLDMLGGMAL